MTRIALLLLLLAIAPALPAAAAPYETTARQAILIDEATGAVLFAKEPDQLMEPSSMSKIMTVYLAFERLKDGSLKMEDEVTVSERAWKMGGSRMFLDVNSRVTIEDLLRGIIVQSGNDAAVALAEAISGSEEAFARLMTERAHELGMKNTTFLNASGWPHEGHLTTARDLAILAEHTIHDFPEYYPLYAEREFTYNGIKQGNRNPLLYRDMGVDGLKTGHAEAAGFGLTASAVRDGRRLILVVNGLPDMQARADETGRLFDWGFRETGNYALFQAGQPVLEADVWLGEAERVALEVQDPLIVTLAREARPDMVVKAIYDGPIPAPIAKGQPVGRIVVTAPGMEPVERVLVAGADVGQLSTLNRLIAAIGYLVWGGQGG